MEIVQPKIVFANGNGEDSAYKYAIDHLGFEDIHKNDSCLYSDEKWRCKIAERQHNGMTQRLIGFPHFSRFGWKKSSKREDIIVRIAQECSKL